MTCTTDDCWCYPHYGGAPGRDYAGPLENEIELDSGETIPAGAFVFMQLAPLPREEWTPNFREDPECPGLGSWFCPVCLGGMSE